MHWQIQCIEGTELNEILDTLITIIDLIIQDEPSTDSKISDNILSVSDQPDNGQLVTSAINNSTE